MADGAEASHANAASFDPARDNVFARIAGRYEAFRVLKPKSRRSANSAARWKDLVSATSATAV